MCKVVGDSDCQAAVFVYKNDCSGPSAWTDVKAINASPRSIRGEWHTRKSHLLSGLRKWNESVDPENAFLCVYAHMGESGLNCVRPVTPSAVTWEVTWQELADELPRGVQYLWLLGCESQECMKSWSPLGSPVRHRLLVTTESKYWQPLLKVFAAEISLEQIAFDDQMSAKIAQAEPELSKHTRYFRPQPTGFVADQRRASCVGDSYLGDWVSSPPRLVRTTGGAGGVTAPAAGESRRPRT